MEIYAENVCLKGRCAVEGRWKGRLKGPSLLIAGQRLFPTSGPWYPTVIADADAKRAGWSFLFRRGGRADTAPGCSRNEADSAPGQWESAGLILRPGQAGRRQ